jgi:hypothetical protein
MLDLDTIKADNAVRLPGSRSHTDIVALIAEVEHLREALAHFMHCRICAEDGDYCEDGKRYAALLDARDPADA